MAGGQGSIVLLFLIYVLAARALGAAGYGDFTLGMTIAMLLMALPAWGTARYASILAARSPERTRLIVAEGVGLICLLALVYFPLVWLTSTLVTSREAVVWVALLLGLDLISREVSILLRLLLRVHDAFLIDMVSVYAERLLMVAGALVVLIVAPEPAWLAGALAAGRVGGTAVTAVLFVRRVGGFVPRFRLEPLRELWRGGTPIAVRRAIGSLSFRVDTVFLGAMRSATEVGWYGTVYTLMDGFLMLPSIVTGSLGPTFSANFAEGRRDVVIRLYRRGLKYLLAAGVFVGAAFAVLADFVVETVYGSEYAPAAAALRLLSVTVIFIFVRRQATEVLDNVDLRSTTAWIFGVGLLVNVVLNLMLIPRYGYLGAAAATVVTEGYLMAAMLWSLHRASYGATFFRILGPPALAIVLPVLIMWLVPVSPLVSGPIAGVVYLAGLTLLGVWDDKDRMLLSTLTHRGKAEAEG